MVDRKGHWEESCHAPRPNDRLSRLPECVVYNSFVLLLKRLYILLETEEKTQARPGTLAPLLFARIILSTKRHLRVCLKLSWAVESCSAAAELIFRK